MLLVHIQWVARPHKMHKQPHKHNHHGGGAAWPSSGVDLMNPHRWRGGRPCTYFLWGHHERFLYIHKINVEFNIFMSTSMFYWNWASQSNNDDKNSIYCHQRVSTTYKVDNTVVLNSLTPKSVLAGMKNSLWEGFWLAKNKHTNIPTMMEPFSPPVAWFWWTKIPHPRESLHKGLDEATATVEGFQQNQ